jgi:CTP:phosphocholine cytidylyltransferase-like protein
MTNPIEELKEKIATMQHNLKVLEKLEAQKTDIEKAYRDAYGHYPETSGFAMSDWDAVSWEAFQKGYEASKNNSEDISRVLIEGDDAYIMGAKYRRVEEPSKPMNEVMDRLENKYKQAEENAASYMTDEVIDSMVKKYQAQKLWNRVRDELGYSIDCCDSIVDLVESWLPEPQSAAGSQNVDVEFLVVGFNYCVRKMKEMLR